MDLNSLFFLVQVGIGDGHREAEGWDGNVGTDQQGESARPENWMLILGEEVARAVFRGRWCWSQSSFAETALRVRSAEWHQPAAWINVD
jgi:hypothetical protein